MKLFTSKSEAGRRYVIDACASTGGFGIVYRAFAESDGKRDFPQALKMFLLNTSLQDRVNKVDQEVGFLARVQSEVVPRLMDYCLDAFGPYLVMEYVPETLETKKNEVEGKEIQDLLASFLRQLPELLRVPYEQGISHCDIHPGNLGITGGTFVLLDWGRARNAGGILELCQGNNLSYLAPEIRKTALVHPLSDVYSAEKLIEDILLQTFYLTEKKSTPLGEEKATLQALRDIQEKYCTPLPASLGRLMMAMTAPADKRPKPDDLIFLVEDVLNDFEKHNFFALLN